MTMNEAEAVEFFDEVVEGDGSTEDTDTYVLESARGRELEVEVIALDRTFVIDKLNELPDEMLEQLSEIDDPENVDEEEVAAGGGTLSGRAVEAFEELCAEGIKHPKFSSHEMALLVQELSLDVLFEIGGRIVELSLDEDGSVTGFRKVD